MVLLTACLVMVFVGLPRLVDRRAEVESPDLVVPPTPPAPSPTAAVAADPPPDLDAGVRRTVEDAIEEGREALAKRDPQTASAAYRRAAILDPGNDEAEEGLRSTEVLAEVLRLEAEAVASEQRGAADAAAAAAARALELDPSSEIARGVARRSQIEARSRTYRELVTRGLTALEEQQFRLAEGTFSAASELRPGTPEVADGLARARAGIRRQTVAAHLARAADAEAKENWAAAVGEYRSVLALDPTLAEARDGLAESGERLEFTRKMSFHLANPARLSTTAVLEEAAELVAEARNVRPRGPQFSEFVARLDDLVEGFSHPVQVVLESDGLTEIQLFRVGRLGAFDRRTVELRPGNYTAIGRRAGYRDVRLTFTVGAGQPPPTVTIRCTEAI